jgi:proton-dependent oligopeptide transporter, POT family
MTEDHELSLIRDFKGKYPKQIWPLFFSEMWERFSFYGMRGMLIFFMVTELKLDETIANLQYGATQAFVYAFTFVGGLFADKILGFRRSLFWGGILMIVGSAVLAIDPKLFFFTGIGFIIIGTGFFKPNISTIVGNLYKDNDPRIDAGFSLFYAGVNIGGLLGGYFCIAIGKRELFANAIPAEYAWNVAFGLAAVVMVISLLTFTQTQKSLAAIGKSPLVNLAPKKRRIYEFLTFAGSLAAIPLVILMVAKTEYTDIFMYTIGPCALVYLIYEMRGCSAIEIKRLTAALLFMIFSIFFWAFFEQSGGSLSLFAANNLDNNLAGMRLDPNGVNNSSNSFFVIVFATLFGLMWLWLNRRGLEPNSINKFGLAFLLLGGGFCVFYLTRFTSDANGVTSLNLFTSGWFVITLGELCLSPIGMSIMTKLSPARLQAVIMGMWFLASAYGQYLAGLLGAGIAEASGGENNYDTMLTYTDGYKQLGIYSAIAAGLLFLSARSIKKLMGGVK